MTRPLKYDDQFRTIINEKIRDKFLYILDVKVQSTAFCQKLNLQVALVLASLFDILIGFFTFLLFLHTIKSSSDQLLLFLEHLILFVGLFFGILGIDCARSLRKANMRIYYIWRLFVTFSILLLELGNHFALLNTLIKGGLFKKIIVLIVFFAVNLYFSKISWSVFIRLMRGHELLIIHGKYLERMMTEEKIKTQESRKYIPPGVMITHKAPNENA